MEVKLSPKIIDAISRGELRKDWRSTAKRVEAQEGKWQLVGVTDRTDRGVAAEVTERLGSVGCRAQVVALLGLGEHPRPWTGWAIFARIPRSIRAPSGRLY